MAIVHAVIPTIRRPVESLRELTTGLGAAGMSPVVLVNSARSAAALAGTDVPHHVTGENAGFSQSINLGAGLRDDWDWLFICNDDVQVEVETLRRAVVDHLTTAPGPGIVYFDAEPDRPINGSAGAWLSLSLVGPVIARVLGHGRQARTRPTARGVYRSFSAVAVSRSTWDRVGTLDERMRFTYEDVDYARRCIAAGVTTSGVQVPGIHHEHSVSGSRYIDRVLPVAVWATVEYLTKWGASRRGARALVATALVVRTPLIVLVRTPRSAHLRGIRRAFGAVLREREPFLPSFEEL